MNLVQVIVPMFNESIPDCLIKLSADEDFKDNVVSCGRDYGYIKVDEKLHDYIIKKGVKVIK